jgi:hypothetical protein
MKITSIEPPLADDELRSVTASDASKRYQLSADMAGSHFSIMEQDRPGSEMWIYMRLPPRAMKKTIISALRAARN